MKNKNFSFWQDVKFRFCKNKAAIIGTFFLLFLIIMAIIGPHINSYKYFETHLELKNSPPSSKFWFGTDELGRDIFTRIWWGARISLSVGIIAAVIDVIIGVIWGTTAAYFKGMIDEIMMRICDILYSIPYLLIVLLLIVIMEPGFLTVLIALTATGWINMSRIIRNHALQILENNFIQSANALGASKKRIIFCHLIPNTFGTIITTMTFTIPTAIFTETFLSFLGLGIQAPVSSWGVMINDSLPALRYYPWRLFFPAIMITLTMFGFNLFGDGLRDAFDPKERR
ncbi:MAG: diguanylate cyclase [Chlamydiae bacterium SM23_39]|nr:MAG: diguanylate cyclase [Chlamydiae bacterium SM23_39]